MAKRVQKSLTSERSVRSLLDPVHIGSPSLGIEYKQVVTETLRKLSRHKFLIMAMVAAALVLGIVAALAMPEALYRRGLHPRGLGGVELGQRFPCNDRRAARGLRRLALGRDAVANVPVASIGASGGAELGT